MQVRLIAGLLFAALAGIPATVQAQTDARIDSLARSVVGTQTPGLAVVVMKQGAIVHRAAYGVADVATKAPFTLDTPFYIASLAKMFTALGVLQLVDAGRLSLDTRLGDVLPNAPAYARAVTIRQVLMHTSGLPDHYDLDPRGEAAIYTNALVDSLLLRADSLLFVPGAKPSYSNSGYVLLARVIERVAGVPYARYVNEYFFRPAGMSSARVLANPADLPAARAIGYAAAGGRFTRNDVDVVPGMAVGAGGMLASMNDLVKWAETLRAGALVSSGSLREASTPALLNNGRRTYWGMGWLAEFHGAKDVLAGKEYVAAHGSLRGFHSLLKWYQKEDLIIIWMANSDSSDVFDALHRIPELML